MWNKLVKDIAVTADDTWASVAHYLNKGSETRTNVKIPLAYKWICYKGLKLLWRTCKWERATAVAKLQFFMSQIDISLMLRISSTLRLC